MAVIADFLTNWLSTSNSAAVRIITGAMLVLVMLGEYLPLATIQQAILEFLCDRDDVVLFGAQAVNAYVNVSRMTQVLNLLSPRAETLTQELRAYLRQWFHIAVRLCQVSQGQEDRVFQVRKPRNRHMVGIRAVQSLPDAQRLADLLS